MGRAQDFYDALNVGIDVDWAKTTPGRTAFQKWAGFGLNIPAVFKDRGFDHVRIRVQDHPATDSSLLDELSIIVDKCLSASVIPIIAYQAEPFKYNPTSPKQLAALIDFWYKTAIEMETYGGRVAFNFIIETTEEVTKHPEALNNAYQAINDVIRPMCPSRIHIVCPHKVSSPESLPQLRIPTRHSDRLDRSVTDRNFIAESHWYAAGPQTEGRKAWGSGLLGAALPAEVDAIANKAELAAKWRDESGFPVWVGAWMPGNFEKKLTDGEFHDDGAPMCKHFSMAQREEFTRVMMKHLKKHGLPHAVNSDTKFYNRETNLWYNSQSPILNKILD